MDTQTNSPFPLKLIRSRKRRKTISIQVKERMVVVRVPYFTPDKVIQDLLRERGEWIREALDKQQRESKPSLWYNHTFLLFGNPLHIVWHDEPQMRWTVNHQEDSLHLYGPRHLRGDPQAKAAVVGWFRNAAKSAILGRVSFWKDRLHAEVGDVRVKDQKSRWGSCSAKRNLNFNWRLVQAPVWVIDYVIVHEICHLWELNHSRRFWKLVEHAFPNYEDAVEWLRRNGKELYF